MCRSFREDFLKYVCKCFRPRAGGSTYNYNNNNTRHLNNNNTADQLALRLLRGQQQRRRQQFRPQQQQQQPQRHFDPVPDGVQTLNGLRVNRSRAANARSAALMTGNDR